MTTEISPPQESASSPSVSNPASKDASARAQGHDLQRAVAEDLTAARNVLSEGRDAVSEKIREAVAHESGAAARRVSGVAEAFRRVGAELEQSGQPDVGRFASRIGTDVKGLADRMEGKDARELAGIAEDFARKQPLAFLGVAALAGLATSRFLFASTSRTVQRSTSMDVSETSARGTFNE